MNTRSVIRNTTAAPVAPVAPAHGLLQPLGLDEVRITDGFWARMQHRNQKATIPHVLHWLDKAGWVANFDQVAAGAAPELRRGREFADSEIYKALEAMAWQLALAPDPELDRSFADLVTRVAAAQQPDGYLNTAFGRPGQGARYSDMEWGHELYCVGHLLQAATARLRTGHDDLLVEVARAAADHVCATFADTTTGSVCGHPEIELGLVEFGRATGESRYLTQAALFLERRGHHTLRDIEYGRGYFQDDVPFRQAQSLHGHAVRALYLAAAAVDIADESADQELLDAAARQWRHAVARRTYLTGGMGSQHQDEAYGEDFALPADRAYSESCAGVASVMLSWRLLLSTGRTGYADLIERTLFNVVAAAPAEDGRAFFYTNTLQQRVPGSVPDIDTLVPRAASSLRAPWFEVSCCPTNIARTMASLGGYLATKNATGIQIHQYATSTIDATLDDGRTVHLDIETDYPRSGRITIRSRTPDAGSGTLSLRVPGWAHGATITDATGTHRVDPGTVTLTDPFSAGPVVHLDLPIEPRLTYPDPRIDAIRGTVAVERGPLVMCAESVDLPDSVDLENVHLTTAVAPEDIGPADPGSGPMPWVNGAGAVQLPAYDAGWPYREAQVPADPARPIDLPLLPYHQWANRGPGTMRVWIPVAP